METKAKDESEEECEERGSVHKFFRTWTRQLSLVNSVRRFGSDSVKARWKKGSGRLTYLDVEMQGFGGGLSPKETPSMSERKFEEDAEDARKKIKRLRQPGEYTIDPQSPAMQLWEWVMLMALTYVILVVPPDVAFTDLDRNRKEQAILDAIDLVVWFLYVVDLALQFFVWYKLPETSGGHWVRNHREIVRYYLRTSFALDLASSLPIGFILTVATGEDKSNLQALRLCKLLRIAKTSRLLSTTGIIRKIRYDSDYSIVKVNVCFVIALFLVMAHWLACIWGYVGNNSASPGNSWLYEYVEYRVHSFYSLDNPKVQYLFALYFVVTTLTTVGYGDLRAFNLTERATVTVMMLIGALMWALVLGTITQAITTLDVDKINYNQTFDQVNWMLRDLDVKKSTRARARAFLVNSILIRRRNQYTALLATLGTGIQTDVCEQVFAAKMSVVPYLRVLNKNIRLLLFKEFRHVLYSPGEEITDRKTLVIVSNAVGQIGYHGRYHYFGDYVFGDFITSDDDPPDLAVSIHYTAAATLSRASVFDICQRYPRETYPIVKARVFYALLKFARLLLARKKRATSVRPSNYLVEYADFHHHETTPSLDDEADATRIAALFSETCRQFLAKLNCRDRLIVDRFVASVFK